MLTGADAKPCLPLDESPMRNAPGDGAGAGGIIGSPIGIIGPTMRWHDHLKAARAPGEAVRAWLLDVLPFAPAWKTARELEAEREAAGVSARALRTARERLLADGAIEKGRDGFQGPWRYRRRDSADDDGMAALKAALSGRR